MSTYVGTGGDQTYDGDGSTVGLGGGAGAGMGFGATPGGAVSAEVARERAEAMASIRNLLAICLMAFVAFLGLTFGMLLLVEIPPISYWATWEFWRFFFDVVSILVVIFAIDLLARSCAPCGSSRPHILGIVVTSIHIVWCLVITGFMIDDMANCATRPWCVAPSGAMSTYFLLHAIGYWGALLFEILIVFTSWRLYTAASRNCPRRCRSGATAFTGAEYHAMHVAGVPTPVSLHQRHAEMGGLLFDQATIEDLKKN